MATPEEILRSIIDGTYSGAIESESLTSVATYRLYNLTGLTSVDFPNATRVGSSAFTGCTGLISANLPKWTGSLSAGSMFDGCTALVGGVFPKLGILMDGCFSGCTSLRYIDMLGSTNNSGFNSTAFSRCTNFNLLIIRRTGSIAPLKTIDNFGNTPFASGGSGGTLYVPSSLIASYQSATNWSTILGYANNQILPIEGSIYETQYADGTPIE